MSRSPAGGAPLEMGESDCFLLAIDREMQRNGQGIHLNQTVLELEGEPQVDRLQEALRMLREWYPVITFSPRRLAPGLAPELAPSRHPASTLPLLIRDENLEAGESNQFQEELLYQTEAEFHRGGTCQLHFCLVRQRDGNSKLLLTWRHLILDGTGAELLLAELDSIYREGRSCMGPATGPQVRAAKHRTWMGRFRAAQPAANFFRELLRRHRFQSLGSAYPQARKARFLVETLSPAESEEIFRLAELRGGLMTSHYYLACATKAHHAIWARRGQGPAAYLISLPVRARKPGSKGPIFQNNIGFHFFCAQAEGADAIPALCASFQEQHARFLREGLAESFWQLQSLMRPVPSRLYIWHLKHRMWGELNSFYHSHTGEFAPGLRSFGGCPVRNGYHIPTVFSPPGTGLFLSHQSGRITVTLSWREGALQGDEAALLKDAFVHSLRTG
jgi:hypothetical protein